MIKRTFHPVGQGAFYTERLSFNNQLYNIVYDCGSTSLSRKVLESRIKAEFNKGDVIDVLFISHFHSDHINGIEFLKEHCIIKTVVLPLLSANAKIVFKIQNEIISSEGNNYNLLIDNPMEFFNNRSAVVFIESNEGESNIEAAFPLENLKHPNQKFKSGIKFKIKEWVYIPFNYKHEERSAQLETELKKVGLSISNINNPAEMVKYKKEIIEAYNVVDGPLNENSLVLDSGPENKKNVREEYSVTGHYYCVSNRGWGRPGCIYTGDFNAKSVHNLNSLLTFVSIYSDAIGTIQIPHHGSVKNF